MTYQQQLVELNEKSTCNWLIYPTNDGWACISVDIENKVFMGDDYTGTTESEAVYAAYSDQFA